MTHMLKGSIGAGILAMPAATSRLGVIYATVLLILVGIFATYCIQLLIASQYQLCKRHRRGYMAYPKSMLFALRDGPPMFKWMGRTLYWLVEIVLIVWQLGICTIFLVFVAENLKQICDYHGYEYALRVIILFLLPPSILLNLIRDLKMLSPLSSLSNIITFAGIMLVCFYLIEDDLLITDEKLRMKRWVDIPSFIGTALFALEAVGVMLALEYNMENPKQFVGLTGLFNISMVVIIILYSIVGIFGYLRFGDKIAASITLNLPEQDKKAQTAKCLFALAIFMSFPLQNFVAYSMLWRRLSRKVERHQWAADYALRVALVVGPWLLAIAVPRLGPFICLFGALCLSLLAMVFPALMSLCIHYSEPKGFGPLKYKLISCVFILVVGTLILISGVYSSVLEIVEVES